MKKRICCIFNYAPLYREGIFLRIDKEYDVQFCFDDMQSDIAQMDYGKFRRQPITIRTKLLFNRFLWRKKLFKLAFKQFDTFIISGDFSISFIPFLAICKIFNKQVYAWGHGLKKWSKYWSIIERPFLKMITGFFTYGEKGRERLIQLGVPADKVFTIYNSLGGRISSQDIINCKSTIFNEHFHNDYPTIVFVGRLTKVKKLDWIVTALIKHNKQDVNYNVLLIGDGPEFKSLYNIVKENALTDRVWFYGECYDDSILDSLLFNSALCVSPGNVGLTALHSMMFGTPVLSHNSFEHQMPEFETIVEGKTGTLYKYSDFDNFCDAIEHWIKKDLDRSEIRANCIQMINNKWNIENQIDILKSVIGD